MVVDVEDILDYAQEYYDLGVARYLGGDRVQWRDLDTGRFSYASDIWDWFREHYDELKAEGAFE